MIIFMRSVEGKPLCRALTEPLVVTWRNRTPTMIPVGFEWDGSSVPRLLQGIFPRHRHPIASCRHDYRCGKAKNKRDRKYADREFQEDVGKTSWWITKKVGYFGVRIGAFFGVGSNF